MKRPSMVICTGLMICLAGCGRKEQAAAQEEGATPVSAEESARVEAELVAPPDAKPAKPDAPAVERLQGAIHPGLTMRLQMYIDKTGKVPETIYEFSNTAVDSMPPAPAGMKYVIDPADKTVKVVRK